MRTKKYRGGFKSKCHFKCKYNCSHNCRQLCSVAKTDKAYHQNAISELVLIKEELKKRIEKEKTESVDRLLKTNDLSEKEKVDLRKILEGDASNAIKDAIKSGFRSQEPRTREGGFSWLNFSKKGNECEKDCEEKCSASCDYLCDESVNIKASLFNKEIAMLKAEIQVLKSVLKS
jgi:hypothetical protein